MSAITVAQLSCAEVGLSDEHRDEHIAVVILYQFIVHTEGYLRRCHPLFRQRMEEPGCLRHKQ